MIRTNIDVT